jgi:tetratricopeptide (TPR) repeat protein
MCELLRPKVGLTGLIWLGLTATLAAQVMPLSSRSAVARKLLEEGLQQDENSRPTATLAAQVMPLSSRSAVARKLLEEGLQQDENSRPAEAEQKFIAAFQADRRFAVAYALAALATRDPRLEQRFLASAKEFAPQASKGEQLLIDWIAAQRESRQMAAIVAMNDFIVMFPGDKRALHYFSRWLYTRGSTERCIGLIEHNILEVDPDYVPALNVLAFAYSRRGDHDKAVAAIRRTVELRPGEPNPRDALGVVLRAAGRFEEALAHFHAANRILEGFSNIGIADTLALLGRYMEARAAYEHAATSEPRLRIALQYRFQNAVTYIREQDFAAADRAFTALAREAHTKEIAEIEIAAYRAMAMYANNPRDALGYLAQSESALQHAHVLSQTMREEQLAQTLRWRAVWLQRARRPSEAQSIVTQLAGMAERSRIESVQRSYHAARGAVLFGEGKFSEAVDEFQEDRDNAISHHGLIAALAKAGEAEEAERERALAANVHRVLIEDAIVGSRGLE